MLDQCIKKIIIFNPVQNVFKDICIEYCVHMNMNYTNVLYSTRVVLIVFERCLVQMINVFPIDLLVFSCMFHISVYIDVTCALILIAIAKEM